MEEVFMKALITMIFFMLVSSIGYAGNVNQSDVTQEDILVELRGYSLVWEVLVVHFNTVYNQETEELSFIEKRMEEEYPDQGPSDEFLVHDIVLFLEGLGLYDSPREGVCHFFDDYPETYSYFSTCYRGGYKGQNQELMRVLKTDVVKKLLSESSAYEILNGGKSDFYNSIIDAYNSEFPNGCDGDFPPIFSQRYPKSEYDSKANFKQWLIAKEMMCDIIGKRLYYIKTAADL